MTSSSTEGIEHFNAGRFEEALRCFRSAIKSGDRGPENRTFVAHVLDAAGKSAEAFAEFVSTLQAFPRHQPAYSGLATLVLSRGALSNAAAALRGALRLAPGEGTVATLGLCAKACRACDDLEGAERLLRKAARLGPRDKKTRRALAEIVRAREQLALSAPHQELTEKMLRRRYSRNTRDKRLLGRLLLAMSRRGLALIVEGRHADAERVFRRALKFAPGDRKLKRDLARLLKIREREKTAKIRLLTQEMIAAEQANTPGLAVRKTLALLTKIERIDPKDARAFLHGGAILFSSGAAARGRALLAKALRLDRGALAPWEKFTALMKLGKYKNAVALAEKMLDGKPGLDELRAFWDPWEWNASPMEERLAELAKFSAAARGPWGHYYAADFPGPEQLRPYERLAGFPRKRYGWMLAKPGIVALNVGRFALAEVLLKAALARKPFDWRTRGFLAETYLCLGRPDDAVREMTRTQGEAPSFETGQVVAWRGALDLWMGRYESALKHLDEALRLGSPYAKSWRGAALLKLGRREEALKELDEALAACPRDSEAYVWRGEAKRELGMLNAALNDLNRKPDNADGDRAKPIWLWALVNRALIKSALGNRKGLRADFDMIPERIVTYIRKKTGASTMEEILRAGLELSKGFRREEYLQATWMS